MDPKFSRWLYLTNYSRFCFVCLYYVKILTILSALISLFFTEAPCTTNYRQDVITLILGLSIWQQAEANANNAILFQMYVIDHNEISIVKYLMVSLHSFYNVGLSIPAAFETLITVLTRIWDDPDYKTTLLFKTNLQKKTLITTMCFSVTNSYTLLSISWKLPLRGPR